tara:strand:+ start:42 stop:527 length:486 start_codon:yes stop_codon:yes gene_type:complete
MKKILLALFIILISKNSLIAEEKPTISNLIESGFGENVTSCAALSKYLEEKHPSQTKKFLDKYYINDVADYFLALIRHKMNDYYYSFDVSGAEDDFKAYLKRQEAIAFLNMHSLNNDEYRKLEAILIKECIPILMEASEDVINDLWSFKRNSIRKLTDLNP